MKKTLLGVFIALGLSACANNANQNSITNQVQQANETQTIYFTGPYDLSVSLKTIDGFQTAILIDDSDRHYLLTAVPVANGVKLANDEGVSLHFKTINNKAEGILNLVPGKDIAVTEFKR